MEGSAETTERHEVVYLFGAGASHACVKWVDSPHGVLMRDLTEPLINEVGTLARHAKYSGEDSLTNLANNVIDDATDFEQVITFLAQSPSGLHREFAEDLRRAFVDVLKARLAEIETDLGEQPVDLYEALLDMYDVEGFEEHLRGFLTLNYDEYIETAMTRMGRDVDFGIDVGNAPSSDHGYRLLKLHGSFGWKHAWPISQQDDHVAPFWIPPGILKSKDEYPFNLLWGLARELLDCDVLRIVGCNLGPNDWDLLSLLFATRHTHATRSKPYRIEVIDSPKTAAYLRAAFPYLEVRSIYEAGLAGERLLFEVSGGQEKSYGDLSPEDQARLDELIANENWFHIWLQHMAEGLYEKLGSITTSRGSFKRLMEAA